MLKFKQHLTCGKKQVIQIPWKNSTSEWMGGMREGMFGLNSQSMLRKVLGRRTLSLPNSIQWCFISKILKFTNFIMNNENMS